MLQQQLAASTEAKDCKRQNPRQAPTPTRPSLVMKILVTNDDGIDSPFLQPLIDELDTIAETTVVAPNREFSWVGKAMSRHSPVPFEELGPRRYALGGTPADCVNIALHHFCPEKPDLIVSGINIGHNASLPTLLSSGTVGAAAEGALQGFPAVACSLQLEKPDFERLHSDRSNCPPPLIERARQAARIIARLAPELATASKSYAVVHNLNFPTSDFSNAAVRETAPALFRSKSLFRKDGDRFTFHYEPLDDVPSDCLTDRQALDQGFISHSIVDFSKLSK